MDAQAINEPADEQRGTTGQLLTIGELAKYLDVPIATVRAWRANRTGPRGIRVGKHIRYRSSDVEIWLEMRSDPR